MEEGFAGEGRLGDACGAVVAGFVLEGVQGDGVALAAFAAQEVKAGGGGDACEPVSEGGFGAEFVEVTVGAQEDFLCDVVEFMSAPGIARGHGEDAGFVAGHDLGECGVIAAQGGGHEGFI